MPRVATRIKCSGDKVVFLQQRKTLWGETGVTHPIGQQLKLLRFQKQSFFYRDTQSQDHNAPNARQHLEQSTSTDR